MDLARLMDSCVTLEIVIRLSTNDHSETKKETEPPSRPISMPSPLAPPPKEITLCFPRVQALYVVLMNRVGHVVEGYFVMPFLYPRLISHFSENGCRESFRYHSLSYRCTKAYGVASTNGTVAHHRPPYRYATR